MPRPVDVRLLLCCLVDVLKYLFYTVFHNYRTPSFQRHNLVYNMRFIIHKIFQAIVRAV